MGAFGAPWVAGEALGAGLVRSLPADNAMTPSGGFVTMGGATPTIMSPTPPSIDLAACMKKRRFGDGEFGCATLSVTRNVLRWLRNIFSCGPIHPSHLRLRASFYACGHCDMNLIRTDFMGPQYSNTTQMFRAGSYPSR